MNAPNRIESPRTTPKSQTLDDFSQSLRDYSHDAFDAFNWLVTKGCSAEWLHQALLALRLAFDHHAHLQDDPDRINKRDLDTLVRNTRWVADEWEKLLGTSFGKEIVHLAVECLPVVSRPVVSRPILDKVHFLNTPSRLRSLARCASKIQRKTEHRRRPLYDDNLADLVVHVNANTRHYYDREVSNLVDWAIQNERTYDASAHCVWRNEHKEALSRARLRLKAH